MRDTQNYLCRVCEKEESLWTGRLGKGHKDWQCASWIRCATKRMKYYACFCYKNVCVCYRVCFLLLCEEKKNISPALDLRIGKEKSERENLSTLLPLSFTFLCVCVSQKHMGQGWLSHQIVVTKLNPANSWMIQSIMQK